MNMSMRIRMARTVCDAKLSYRRWVEQNSILVRQIVNTQCCLNRYK